MSVRRFTFASGLILHSDPATEKCLVQEEKAERTHSRHDTNPTSPLDNSIEISRLSLAQRILSQERAEVAQGGLAQLEGACPLLGAVQRNAMRYSKLRPAAESFMPIVPVEPASTVPIVDSIHQPLANHVVDALFPPQDLHPHRSQEDIGYHSRLVCELEDNERRSEEPAQSLYSGLDFLATTLRESSHRRPSNTSTQIEEHDHRNPSSTRTTGADVAELSAASAVDQKLPGDQFYELAGGDEHRADEA